MAGEIGRIAGSLVEAQGLEGARMLDLVLVGREGLVGEIIRIERERVSIQVYEDTSGLYVGEPVESLKAPLSVELGPGLLGRIFDGLQRPLTVLADESGAFIRRGIRRPGLSREKRWVFAPTVAPGDGVEAGDVVGEVDETPGIRHRILVPLGVGGVVASVEEGEATIEDPVVTLEDGAVIRMASAWPAKVPRPSRSKGIGRAPFATGQRVLDTLFPIPVGGTAILPGGFGTGKTVLEQTLAKFAAADVIVYIGCGERGNEMTDVLTEFPELEDPRSGRPLMERTIVVANTSNMPVAAREASIYTGVAMAEYYRDMGYDVALLADSTSRWAEAMREIASRMEEMPGEEGYPPYLPARIASFYERAGVVETLGQKPREGSLTIVGAVSPPGGDFSEPVTQGSLVVAGALWALDAPLAYRRHFPAINWNRSHSLYAEALEPWYRSEVSEGWPELKGFLQKILQKEAELQEIVQLVGPDALEDPDKLTLEVAMLVRDTYLQQSAFSPADAYSDFEKQRLMMEILQRFHDEAGRALEEGRPLKDLMADPVREEILRMREIPSGEMPAFAKGVADRLVGLAAPACGEEGGT